MSHPLEYIEWLDHCSHEDSNWRNIEDAKELGPFLVQSLGFVVHETEDSVVLVQNISYVDDDYNDKYAGDVCILKPLIKKRKRLKV